MEIRRVSPTGASVPVHGQSETPPSSGTTSTISPQSKIYGGGDPQRQRLSQEPKASVYGQTMAIFKRYITSKRRAPCKSLLTFVFPIALLVLLFLAEDELRNFKYGNIKNASTSYQLFMYQLIFILISALQCGYGITWLVEEKYGGFLLLMQTMGLKKLSYYIGVSAGMLCFTLPLCLAEGYLYYKAVQGIQDYSIFTAVIFFVAYALQLTSITFALGSLINAMNLRHIGIIVSLFIVALRKAFLSLCLWLPQWLRFTSMILGLLSPDMAFSNLIQVDIEKAGQESNSTLPQDFGPACPGFVSQTLGTTILIMILWTIIWYSFAWYFDEVSPWQSYKSREPLCYFLKRKRKRLWSNDNDEAVRIPDPLGGIDSRYFEKPPENKPLGIYIDRVTKSFSGLPVVDSLSMSIYSGQITLLLGHNGAGKTTLMNMITGILRPNQGELYINGYDVHTCPEDAKGNLGLCPQESILMDELTIDDHMDLFTSIKSGYSGYIKQQHIHAVLLKMGLIEHREKLVSQLSGGMKRKLNLALAFAGNSKVLILDEPSSGLDPESRKVIWDVIRQSKASRTVLLSTQHMEEADYLGDRTAIMSAGKIVCCGSSIFLKEKLGSGYSLRIECGKDYQSIIMAKIVIHFPKAKLDSGDGSPESGPSQGTEMKVELITEDKTSDDNLIKLLEDLENNGSNLGIKSFGLRCSTLEEVFLNSSKVFAGAAKHNINQAALEIETTKDKISLISTHENPHHDCKELLSAFINKHLLVEYRAWKETLLLRFLIPALIMYDGAASFSRFSCTQQNDFKFGILCIIFLAPITRILSEIKTKFKTVQLCSLANQKIFWISRIVAELLSGIFCGLVFIISLHFLMDASQASLYGGRIQIYAVVLVFMIVFIVSVTLLICILSFLTYKDGLAFILLLVITEAGTIIQYIIPAFTKLVNILPNFPWETVRSYLYYIVPSETLGRTFSNFGDITSRDNCKSPGTASLFDWSSQMYMGMIIMLLQIMSFAVILYIVDKFNIDADSIFNCICDPFCLVRKRPSGMDLLDEDVIKEEIRTRSLILNEGGRTSHALITTDLTKSYVSQSRAVDGLAFAVGKSECFGLLGANGAGKSTTFSMFTGDVKPDYGNIICNNIDISSGLDNYTESLGYDPQTNLETPLTPTDAMYFMARLRGIRDEASIKAISMATFDVFGMLEHAHKRIDQLSGGTKRKLSLAIALVGSPPVLLLDEPTAGIDPGARRDIWSTLAMLRSKNRSSIIISSHAMEECEAICDRISIMTKGRLRCIGSFQHLRSKYGQGYVIRIHFNVTQTSNELQMFEIDSIKDHLFRNLNTKVDLDDKSSDSVTFKITSGKVLRSSIFKVLKSAKQIHPHISYIVSDSTLEDIFCSLVKEQKEQEKLYNFI